MAYDRMTLGDVLTVLAAVTSLLWRLVKTSITAWRKGEARYSLDAYQGSQSQRLEMQFSKTTVTISITSETRSCCETCSNWSGAQSGSVYGRCNAVKSPWITRGDSGSLCILYNKELARKL